MIELSPEQAVARLASSRDPHVRSLASAWADLHERIPDEGRSWLDSPVMVNPSEPTQPARQPLTRMSAEIRLTYLIQVEFAGFPDRPRPVSVTISRLDDGAVTSTDLRAVPVASVVSELLQDHQPDPGTARSAPSPASPAGSGARRADYQRVAAIYSQALARGQAPTRAVSEALQVSRGYAGSLVARARQRGLLPPPPARAGAARTGPRSPAAAQDVRPGPFGGEPADRGWAMAGTEPE